MSPLRVQQLYDILKMKIERGQAYDFVLCDVPHPMARTIYISSLSFISDYSAISEGEKHD